MSEFDDDPGMSQSWPFDEAEFESFLAESQMVETGRRYGLARKAEFQAFLEERGVRFSGQQETPETDSEEAAVIEDNDAHLHMLAGTAAIRYVRSLEGKQWPPEVETLEKKKLQAAVIIKGLGAAWLELIDVKFPGQPLGPEDSEFLIEQLEKDAKEQVETDKWLEENIPVIVDFLAQQGLSELNSREFAMVEVLYPLMHAARRMPKQASTFREAAHSILVEYGFNTGPWVALLERFFTPSQE